MHATTAISPAVEAPAGANLRQVTRVVRGRPTSDGAGVKLTRVIGQPALDMALRQPGRPRVPPQLRRRRTMSTHQ